MPPVRHRTGVTRRALHAMIAPMKHPFFAFALMLAACAPAAPPAAQAQVANGIEVRDAWAAPTPGDVDVAAGYLTIVNRGREADRLVAIESARAARVEVHEMSMDGAVMRMRPLAGLDIPAGGQAALRPSGNHLMFIDITQAFVAGESIPVRLQFERAGAVEVQLPVRRGASHGH
jgi:hypothetical protein